MIRIVITSDPNLVICVKRYSGVLFREITKMGKFGTPPNTTLAILHQQLCNLPFQKATTFLYKTAKGNLNLASGSPAIALSKSPFGQKTHLSPKTKKSLSLSRISFLEQKSSPANSRATAQNLQVFRTFTQIRRHIV